MELSSDESRASERAFIANLFPIRLSPPCFSLCILVFHAVLIPWREREKRAYVGLFEAFFVKGNKLSPCAVRLRPLPSAVTLFVIFGSSASSPVYFPTPAVCLACAFALIPMVLCNCSFFSSVNYFVLVRVCNSSASCQWSTARHGVFCCVGVGGVRLAGLKERSEAELRQERRLKRSRENGRAKKIPSFSFFCFSLSACTERIDRGRISPPANARTPEII